ncbi:MAG TPA: YciI family protein [Jatrophihabitantaceae bacterium]|nr:YciI family protein [Jatrophihabitantaceae bacterium]
MPRFLVLIYGDEQRWADASQEWDEENGRRHRKFLDDAGAAVLTGGEIVPSAQAVSIRGDDPAGSTSPGPFVQADKGIGGYYVIQADDLDAAVELARGIPEATTPYSGVEVRQMP